MTQEEFLQHLQSEVDVARGMQVAGAMNAETLRIREEDLQLSRVMVESNRYDPEIVSTALDLQRQSIEDGVAPVPRLLRLLREVRGSEADTKNGIAPPPAAEPPRAVEPPPPPHPPAPRPASTSSPLKPLSDEFNEFRSGLPDDSFRAPAGGELQPSAPAAPVAALPQRASSVHSDSGMRKSRPPGHRTRFKPEPPPEPPPSSSKKMIVKAVVIALVLGVLAGGGYLAWKKFGGSSDARLDEAKKIFDDAEKERVAGHREAISGYRQVVEKCTPVVESRPKLAAAWELRALARWRLSVLTGNPDPDIATDCAQALALDPKNSSGAVIRGLDGLLEMVRRNGGWEPLPGKILTATLSRCLMPSQQRLLTGADALPARFGNYPDEAAEAVRKDLRAAPTGSPLAPLATRALSYLDNASGGDPSSIQEDLAWTFAAAASTGTEAKRLITEGLGRFNDSVQLLTLKAMISAAEGRFDEAADGAGAVLAREDSHSGALVIRGAANLARSQVRRAIDDLDRARGKGETSALFRAIRATALGQNGQAEAALAEFESKFEEYAIPALRVERAYLFVAQNQPDRVRDELQVIAQKFPADSRLAGLSGQLLWHAGDFDGALREFERALTLNPDPDAMIEANELIALVSLAKGDAVRAKQAYLRAANVRRADDFLNRWEQMLRIEQDWAGLRDMGRFILEKDGRNVRAWRLLMDACLRLEAWGDVLAVATKLLELRPKPNEFRSEDLATLVNRSYALERMGKLKESLDDMEFLVSKASGELMFIARRALIRSQMGQYPGAREDFERVLSAPLPPNNQQNQNALMTRIWAMTARAITLVGEAQSEAEDDRKKHIDSAMQILRDAFSEGLRIKDLPRAPFESLKDTPEFKGVLAQAQAALDNVIKQWRENSVLGVNINLQQEGRIVVSGTVRNSGARRAGLMANDVILAVNGTVVRGQPELARVLTTCPVGAKIALKFERTLRPNFKVTQVREVTLTDKTIFQDR